MNDWRFIKYPPTYYPLGVNLKKTNNESLPEMTGWTMLIAGILAAILGIIMIIWPNATLEIGLLILGIIIMVVGIIGVVKSAGTDTTMTIIYALYILIGLALAIVPHFMAEVAAYMFAILLILIGIIQIADIGMPVSNNKTVSLVIGIIFVLLAIIIMIFPDQTIKAAMWIFGALLIITGCLLAINGWRFKSLKVTIEN